jgi:predicted ATPase
VTKIVLTGAPGAGKSVISDAIVAANPRRMIRVPESATHVFSNLKTRWDRVSPEGLRQVQTRIYENQVAQEIEFARKYPNHILILDRGTIDGAAYWPDGADAFWPSVNTTHADELRRYDAIILLETAATLGIYDGDASNPVRFEDAAGAIASGKVLEKLWGSHPRVRRIKAYHDLNEKISAVAEAIRAITD